MSAPSKRYTMDKGRVALGCEPKGRPYVRRINIDFDDEMFGAIRARADRERTSFAEQVRTFCEWGLETAAEDDG
jgi:hypothetical protein